MFKKIGKVFGIIVFGAIAIISTGIAISIGRKPKDNEDE